MNKTTTKLNIFKNFILECTRTRNKVWITILEILVYKTFKVGDN